MLLNAAAALLGVQGPDAADLTAQVAGKLDAARESIDSGAAARTLQTWVEPPGRHAPSAAETGPGRSAAAVATCAPGPAP